jgi:hypothetical protein
VVGSHGGSVGDDGIEFEIIGGVGSVKFVSEGVRRDTKV